MQNETLLSIIIATKNRQKYLLKAVESILEVSDNSFELVVQDNSDEDTLKLELSKYKHDKRLVYRYTNESFSFIDNFNASIELSTGRYLCLIGDDDGINPELFEVVKWMKLNNIDALSGNLAANYRWAKTGAPNTFFTKMTDSTLTITHFDGKLYKVNIEDSLQKLMKNGATNYLEFMLPKLYHGVIKRSFFEKVKGITGQYINGLSPDIYSSVSLACLIDNLVYIDYPITIPGVCAESGSIREGQKKDHSKKLADAPHFKNRPNYVWSKEVPEIFCVQTIWADSCIAAIRDMGREDLMNYFDKYMLYANIIEADKSLKSLIYEQYIKTDTDKAFLNKAYRKGPLIKFIKNRALGRLRKILKLERFDDFLELDTIVEATHKLTEYLRNHDFSIKNILKKW
ncbi:glycosyltransferase family 2 protein [Sphingobacterium multivorum]|uniref:glycosyltransferase family 2 protein n=1 Tax=Sphingobacterium multivorum TaxID=28454 RepID=UPI00289E042E|nr:glycosyltransferase family 2 protein [Sphingobacterium multivorum]